MSLDAETAGLSGALPLTSRALYHTTLAFEAWERANNAVLRCGLRVIQGPDASRAETPAQRASRRRRRADAVLQAFDGASLLELCWARCAASTGAQFDMMETINMPAFEAARLQRRRHAAGVVADFLQGWALSKRAQSRGARSQLLVHSSRGHASGSPPTTRTVWKPNKLPVKMLVRLVRVHGGAGLQLRRESRREEFMHAIYCLWLINPIVLGLMVAILLTCDVAIPLVWFKVRALGTALSLFIKRSAKEAEP